MTGQELAPRVADGETCCQAQTPSGTGGYWYCVAAAGHDGDHVAWAFGEVGHTWPQVLPGRDCAVVSPQAECTGDAACTADHDTPTGAPRIRHTGVVMPPARECPDCRSRASGNVPNVHRRSCRHFAVTELRNSTAVAVARNGMASYGQPGPRDYPYLCGLLSDALARVLAEIDRQAGAL